MFTLIGALRASKLGATASEYALILAILSGIIIAGLTLMTNGINNAFTSYASHLNSGS